MPDRPWKREERQAAALIGGTRYPANSGGRVDAEGPGVVAQVKHVKRLSLAQIEALAVEAATLGQQKGKIGLLVVKRRAGQGQVTPRLVVLTEDTWRRHSGGCADLRRGGDGRGIHNGPERGLRMKGECDGEAR